MVVIAAVGCGYVKSGHWDDDASNWNRAFGQPVPKGWNIVHSRYWRYPHFTYEGGYYFHVRVSGEARQLVMQPDYIRLRTEEAHMQGPCDAQPPWFAPKGFGEYEVWGAKDGTGNYRILIDPKTSDVFLMDCQF
ncbi:MAG TPA: hypothetical protein VNY30_11090 [Bryobacteraceae bacterium]|nr:hypothetical protein [Bryobacteraceae bacterium]